MNLNISLWGALTWLCYYVIINFLLRFLSAKLTDTSVGKALMFVTG